MAQKAEQAQHDVIRGVLILIVMFDHNDIIRNVASVNAWFLPMTFHVAGFLLLPFLARPKPLSWPMLRDHAVRYLVPFLFAVLAYSLVFEVAVARLPVAQWLGADAAALVFADPWSLHDATGFIMLWFLPALLSTVVLLALFNSVSGMWRLALAGAGLAVHLGIGAVPINLRFLVPQGVLIALYILPMGLALRAAIPWLRDRRRPGWALVPLAGLILLLCWWRERGTEIEVATLVMPTLVQMLDVLANDASDLCFLFVLISLAPMLARMRPLVLLGQYSLVVYLVHPILYKPILAVLLHVSQVEVLTQPWGMLRYWAGAAASVLCAGAISLGVAMAIQASFRLRTLLTPRDFAGWLPVAAFARQPVAAPES